MIITAVFIWKRERPGISHGRVPAGLCRDHGVRIIALFALSAMAGLPYPLPAAILIGVVMAPRGDL